MRRRLPALGLFLLAPLVGEFLLGNMPITALVGLILLAPFYGGGALLIRETARRWQLGWPSMLVLCLVYGIVAEALVNQSLFNPNYVGLRLLDYGYIPSLGISAWLTICVLSIHMIWSMAVPIALVESFTPTTRQRPWLGWLGFAVVAMLFIGSGAVLFIIQQAAFMASGTQLLVSGIIVVALVIIAFLLGRRNNTTYTATKTADHVLGLGGVAFLLGSAFLILSSIVHSNIPASLNVSGMLALLLMGAVLLWRRSRRSDWTTKHIFAVAGGLLLVYAWYGFVQVPSVGDQDPTRDQIGNAIFASAAVVLLIIGSKRIAAGEHVPTDEATAGGTPLSGST